MKKVLTESMTKIQGVTLSLLAGQLHSSAGNVIVDLRIWCHVENGTFIKSSNDNVEKLVREAIIQSNSKNLNDIAETILQQGEINAVEIIDHFSGDGIVVYSNWP